MGGVYFLEAVLSTAQRLCRYIHICPDIVESDSCANPLKAIDNIYFGFSFSICHSHALCIPKYIPNDGIWKEALCIFRASLSTM